MPNFVSWFEIYVDDMERAKAFYSAVLDNSFQQLVSADEGGAVIFGKKSIDPWGCISICRDTEGNMFGLHSIK